MSKIEFITTQTNANSLFHENILFTKLSAKKLNKC